MAIILLMNFKEEYCAMFGVGNGNPLQYSCLENSLDRGNWRATVHGVVESDATEHTGIVQYSSFKNCSLSSGSEKVYEALKRLAREALSASF